MDRKDTTNIRKVKDDVGIYMVGPEIGRGTYGKVFQGLNSKTGAMVAIKQFKTSSKQQQEELQKEVSSLQQLDHPNIVKYIDCISNTKHTHVILEFVEAGSLYDIMEQFGVFPETLISYYIEQVLLALQYLHSKGVVHKDIKAANILLTKRGVVKLADFGLTTKFILSENQALRNSGVPSDMSYDSVYWMAPEVLSQDTITDKSDIWSIGATIVELLVGIPPWGEEFVPMATYKILEEDPLTLLPTEFLSKPLLEFVAMCFERDVQKRPSASELLEFTFVMERESSSEPPTAASVRRTVYQHNMIQEAQNFPMNKRKSLAGNGLLSTVMQLQGLKTDTFHLKSQPTSEEELSLKKLLEENMKNLALFNENEKETEISHPRLLILSEEEQLAFKQAQIQRYLQQQEENKRILEIQKRRAQLKSVDFSSVQIKFLETVTKTLGFRAWTEYNVEVTLDNQTWTISRRFREFHKLHTSLEKRLNDIVLPPLPPKKRFGILAPAFVNQRRRQLQAYLTQLLSVPEVLPSKELNYFLIEG